MEDILNFSAYGDEYGEDSDAEDFNFNAETMHPDSRILLKGGIFKFIPDKLPTKRVKMPNKLNSLKSYCKHNRYNLLAETKAMIDSGLKNKNNGIDNYI